MDNKIHVYDYTHRGSGGIFISMELINYEVSNIITWVVAVEGLLDYTKSQYL